MCDAHRPIQQGRILPSVPLSLEGRTRNLIARFGDYVQSFGSTPAFNDEQLGAHLETLALRSQLGSAATAANNAEFAKALRHTLELWRMNTRGAKLVSPPAFEASLQRCAADIASFENDHLESEALKAAATAERLWSLIERLRSLRPACGWWPVPKRFITCCRIWLYRWTGSSPVLFWLEHVRLAGKRRAFVQVCVRCVP